MSSNNYNTYRLAISLKKQSDDSFSLELNNELNDKVDNHEKRIENSVN